MNATEYSMLLDAAVKASGPSDAGWNMRFKQAVESHGLQLSAAAQRRDDHLYPNGAPFAAPFPFGEDGAWPLGTRVLWRMPPGHDEASPDRFIPWGTPEEVRAAAAPFAIDWDALVAEYKAFCGQPIRALPPPLGGL